MKPTNIELFAEDVQEIMSADNFGKAISNDDVMMSNNTPISIKYDYLDIDKTEYNFMQAFTIRDTNTYFSMMKQLSSCTISKLEKRARELHFRRSEIKGNIRKALEKLLPQALKSDAIVYHFALYTDSQLAERSKGVRSPHVFTSCLAHMALFIFCFLTLTTN